MNGSTALFNECLDLQLKHSQRVEMCFDVINQFLPQSEIYLFGSYAKRKIKENSDIDLLVLTEYVFNPKELQEIRWNIEDALYAINHNAFEMDLKLYTKEFYKNQLNDSYFFIEIEKYKKDLRDVKWN